MEGEVIDPGSTRFGINKDGFVIHSAIHEARRDIHCVIHLHTNAGIAVSFIHRNKRLELTIIFLLVKVSSMNCGLLPISGEAVGVCYCIIALVDYIAVCFPYDIIARRNFLS